MDDNTNIYWKTLGERDARIKIGPRFTSQLQDYMPDHTRKGIPIYLKAYYETRILIKLTGKSHK